MAAPLLLDDDGLEAALSLLDEYDELSTLYSQHQVHSGVSGHHAHHHTHHFSHPLSHAHSTTTSATTTSATEAVHGAPLLRTSNSLHDLQIAFGGDHLLQQQQQQLFLSPHSVFGSLLSNHHHHHHSSSSASSTDSPSESSSNSPIPVDTTHATGHVSPTPVHQPTALDHYAYSPPHEPPPALQPQPTTDAPQPQPQPTTEAPPPQQPVAGKATKRRKRPIGFNSNHARDERRKELIYLRQKVEELETQLTQLQRPGTEVSSTNLLLLPPAQQNALQQLSINSWSRNRALPASTSAAPSGGSAAAAGDRASTLSKESSVWKELATRQHTEREKAEMENIRLKLILEEQIKIAKNLHTMLTKKTTAKLVESFGLGTSASRTQAAAPTDDDKAIFEDLLRTADQCYREIDSVFAANGLADMETSHRDAQIKIDDVHGTFLEIIANKVMPFDMEATATAVWQHMTHSMQNIPLRFYYEKHPQKMENTDDTVLERIGAELYVNGKKADFQVKQIIRRYAEADRVILIWGAYIDSLEFCDEPTAGIRFREKGYLMIKRPASMSSEFTLLQTCYIITPELSADIPDKDPKVGALTEFVLNSTAWNITASHQMIENVLLDQSFRSKRPCT